MRVAEFTDGHAAPLPVPVTVVWGAHTDDHWYRLDVTLGRVADVTPPPWMGYEFDGAGPIGNVNVEWSMRRPLARLGLSVVGLSLTATDAAGYAALTETRSEEGV